MGPPVELSVGPVVAGWSPREPAVAVHLTGRFVEVVPLAPEHAEPLFASLCGPGDEALWTYRPDERPVDLPAAGAWVGRHLDARPAMQTMVVVPRGDTACGLISYMRIEPAHGQVEVAGVLFARRLQRTPAATEAVHLLMAHAFETLGYRRFEWKCDALNEPSRRAAARLGFRPEGRFRQHMVVRGRNRDTDWFSVLDTEWPALAAAHRRWLAPDNFDTRGRQRLRLSDLTAARG